MCRAAWSEGARHHGWATPRPASGLREKVMGGAAMCGERRAPSGAAIGGQEARCSILARARATAAQEIRQP